MKKWKVATAPITFPCPVIIVLREKRKKKTIFCKDQHDLDEALIRYDAKSYQCGKGRR